MPPATTEALANAEAFLLDCFDGAECSSLGIPRQGVADH